MILVGSAFLTVYILAELSTLFKESPIALFAAIHLANIRTVAVFGSYISFILYSLDQPDWMKSRKSYSASTSLPPEKEQRYSPKISFLVPAANEELLIGRCIRSIDEACYKYPVRNEIIVIDDGSVDSTSKIAEEALRNLKYCTGNLYTIASSGKGTALQHGLEKTVGEIVFRIDADSEIDKEAVEPVIRHFQDPTVGSVGGMIVPLELKSSWQKMVALMYVMFNNVNKRTQGAADSILIQSGAYSVFRRDALIKIGGWTQNQFGEDGEITNRMGRYGYKLVFEPDSIVYGDIPDSLHGIMSQRARWSIAYYHARGRNLELVTNIKQFRRPRSVFFLLNMLSHGGGIIHGLMWSLVAAAVVAGYFHPAILVSHAPSLILIPFEIMIVPLVVAILAIVMLLYWLKKYFGGIGLMKYFPLMWVYSPINTMLVIVTAMETALYWSSKWRSYSTPAYQDLRKEMKANIDPLHG
jgi:cellulose synthase/poly-beta-1,6-N-acetylglucosamine synthase-like glycosyltransferase